MDIIRGLHNLRPRHRGTAVTIGNFDGVHRGHKALVAHLVARAAALGVPTTLVTFEPQPREFFRGNQVPARLTRFREKASLLAAAGVDRLLCLPFTKRLAATSAEAVVDDILVGGLGTRHLVIGDDFRFGADRSGDFAMLEAAGAAHGFAVEAMGTLSEDAERVSSTRVRECLAAGDVATAERLLGHPYRIMGRVVHGRRLGRTLGVPTLNIPLQRYRAALEGVFVVEAELHPQPGPGEALAPPVGQRVGGVANIGIRPTVEGREPLLEVHLLDGGGDLYGRLVSVRFLHKLRDEQRFDGIDALAAQLQADIASARAWLAAA